MGSRPAATPRIWVPVRAVRVTAGVLAAALVLGLVAVQCSPSLLSPGPTPAASGLAVGTGPGANQDPTSPDRSGGPGPSGPGPSGPPIRSILPSGTTVHPTPIATLLATLLPGATRTAPPTPGGTPGQAPTAGPTQAPTAGPTRTPSPTGTPGPTPVRTPSPTRAPTPPPAGSCPVFPASNVWNRDISGLPVASNSAAMISAIGLSRGLHPDFGSYAGYGIPFNVVGAATPKVSVSFRWPGESDAGPYPIPTSPKIEAGSDGHMLLLDTSACRLYELYAAVKSGTKWTAGSGAIWNLRANTLRPDGWTSADAAGLPIYPGLVRYDEVARGVIAHAIRFTAPSTCAGHIYPARHDAGSGSCSTKPPMGLRIRLKASVNISGFGPQSKVILQALKRYGMLLADNGSSWYITGAPDPHWNDDELHGLGSITGADFEVVDTSGLRNG